MSQDSERIEQDVQAAVDGEEATIAERVRAITLRALSQGVLDAAALKQVIAAVVKGAQQGIARPGGERTAALREAVRGLDEALVSAAEATQLAVQEAASRTGEFSRESLKTAVDQLGTLESQFVDTLADAAKSASGHAQATLRDLAEHARSSGTAVGGRVRTALSQLARSAPAAAREQVEGGRQTLRNEAALLANLAAGVLRGIADRLHAAPPDKTEPPPTDRSS